jgi:hypothetical protein
MAENYTLRPLFALSHQFRTALVAKFRDYFFAQWPSPEPGAALLALWAVHERARLLLVRGAASRVSQLVTTMDAIHPLVVNWLSTLRTLHDYLLFVQIQ